MSGSVAWTSLKVKWQLRSFRVTHYVIFNVILNAFYELNRGKLTFFVISFIKRIQNDVHDDAMRDAKWSYMSRAFSAVWRSFAIRQASLLRWVFNKS